MEEKLYYKFNETLNQEDYTSFAKALPAFKALILTYAALVVFLGIFIAATADGNPYYAIVYIPLIIMVIVVLLLYPKSLGKNLYKNALSLYGPSPISSEIAFCEDYIYDTDANGYRRYSYDKIKKIVEKKNYCFLMISKNAGIIVKKDSLTYGEGDFVAFIKTKAGI